MNDILRTIFWPIVIVGLGFAYRACAQEVPDAPQPQKCQTVTMDDAGRLSYKDVVCGSLRTEWRVMSPPTKKPVTFLTFRKSWQDPPLRTSRQVFTKKFVLLHVGAGIAMAIACRNPRSGESWGSEAPVPAFLVGMDYLMSRFFTEAMSVEAPVYAMQHYARAAAK